MNLNYCLSSLLLLLLLLLLLIANGCRMFVHTINIQNIYKYNTHTHTSLYFLLMLSSSSSSFARVNILCRYGCFVAIACMFVSSQSLVALFCFPLPRFSLHCTQSPFLPFYFWNSHYGSLLIYISRANASSPIFPPSGRKIRN